MQCGEETNNRGEKGKRILVGRTAMGQGKRRVEQEGRERDWRRKSTKAKEARR